MQSADLVVFDMIGTTITASEKIPEAFVRAFETKDIRLAPADIETIRGRSKIDGIRELLIARGGEAFAEREAQNVYGAFKQFLLDCYRTGPLTPIEGAEATFDWCRSNGIRVALTTGFDRDLATLLVDRLEWSGRIDALVCNDDVGAGRPAPDLILTAMRRLGLVDVARVVSIGDTVSDLEAGANAGTGINVGVLSGAHSQEQLQVAPHSALIASVAELPGLLDGWQGPRVTPSR